MINAKIKEIFSLLTVVKYVHDKNTTCDFSNRPRPCHNFAFLIEGEAIIQSGEQTLYVKAGDILFIPKNTTYISNWIASPKAVNHSLHFSFHSANDPFLNKIIPVQLLDNSHFNELYNLLINIENHQFSKGTESFFALSSFYSLCGELSKSISFKKTKVVNKSIIPAINYIEQNYDKQFSVEYLASLCFLSPSRFYYLFKEQTKASPIVYKNQIAVQNAMHELLYNTDLSIKEISEKHGFTSFIYFERIFKKTTGKTPSQYRKDNLLL